MSLEMMAVAMFVVIASALSYSAHLDHDLQKECFKAAQVNSNIKCGKEAK